MYDNHSFTPSAKLVDGKSYSIISDYLGTPILSYDENGRKVWERELDIYGKARKGDSRFIPFLYQGQYYDQKTELAYNRFRYYSPDSGRYISQDPIGLHSDEFNFYAYVDDPSILLDVAGLASSTYVKFKRWKRGDTIDQPLPDGSNPSWGTVRGRYWKNRYEASKNSGQFTKKRDRQNSSRAHSPILLLIKQKTVF